MRLTQFPTMYLQPLSLSMQHIFLQKLGKDSSLNLHIIPFFKHSFFSPAHRKYSGKSKTNARTVSSGLISMYATLTVHEVFAALGNHVCLGALFRATSVQLAHLGTGALDGSSLCNAAVSNLQLRQTSDHGFWKKQLIVSLEVFVSNQKLADNS